MSHKEAPPVRHDDPEMRGQRSRNANGRLRRKREDTRVDTIEEQYDVDFDVRGDMELGNLLKKERAGSLSELLRKHGN